MRIFIHEYITSGALDELPPSLLKEGEAMRQAVIRDCLLSTDLSVITTSDRRLPVLNGSRIQELRVESPEDESGAFQRACLLADAVCLIAPEIDGVLVKRLATVSDLLRQSGGQQLLINASGLVGPASDKWVTAQRLAQADVPTISTCLASETNEWPAFPVVVKPRDGAGALGIRILRNEHERDRVLKEFAASLDAWIVQPFLSGRASSCLTLWDRNGQLISTLPPGEQHVNFTDRVEYQGGLIPAQGIDQQQVRELAVRAITAVNDAERGPVIGPVGVDLIWCEASQELLVVEINPRMTTSFVGYQALSTGSLMRQIVAPDTTSSEWRAGTVRFTADGQVDWV